MIPQDNTLPIKPLKSEASDLGKTRPLRIPRTSKDFNKVVQETEPDITNPEETTAEEAASSKSLFDVSGATKNANALAKGMAPLPFPANVKDKLPEMAAPLLAKSQVPIPGFDKRLDLPSTPTTLTQGLIKDKSLDSPFKDTSTPTLPKDTSTPIVQKDSLTPKLSKDPSTPIVQKDSLTPKLSKDPSTPIVQKDSLTPKLSKDSVAPALPRDTSARSLPKDSLTPKLPRDSVAPALPKDALAPTLPLPKNTLKPTLPVSKDTLTPKLGLARGFGLSTPSTPSRGGGIAKATGVNVPSDPNVAEAEEGIVKDESLDIPGKPLLPKDTSEIGANQLRPKTIKQGVLNAEIDTSALPTKDKAKTPVKVVGSFIPENADLSTINPLALPLMAMSEIDESMKGKEVVAEKTLKEIIAQLVEGIKTLKTEGKTETVVDLKFPPSHILEGAQVRLVTVETAAKNTFSVDFGNLSVQAKQFLDPKLDDLRKVAEQNGIIFERVTTSTNAINIGTETDTDRFARYQEGDEEDPRQQQRKK